MPNQASVISNHLAHHDSVTNLQHVMAQLTLSEFKVLSRDVLARNPELITAITEGAQRFQKTQGGDLLLRNLAVVQQRLSKLPVDKRSRFLNRALRRRGATTRELLDMN